MLKCLSWKQYSILAYKVWKSILFIWKSVWFKVTDECKKWAQICARAPQFLDALPLALMKLENDCALARQSWHQSFATKYIVLKTWVFDAINTTIISELTSYWSTSLIQIDRLILKYENCIFDNKELSSTFSFNRIVKTNVLNACCFPPSFKKETGFLIRVKSRHFLLRKWF